MPGRLHILSLLLAVGFVGAVGVEMTLPSHRPTVGPDATAVRQLETALMPLNPRLIGQFRSVAFGTTGVPQSYILHRWDAPVDLCVQGRPTAQDSAQVDRAIGEVNAMLRRAFVTRRPCGERAAEIEFSFIGGDEFRKHIPTGWPAGTAFAWTARGRLTAARVFVVVQRIGQHRRNRAIREQLIRSLGFTNVSRTPFHAMLYDGPGRSAKAYTELDARLLRLLYAPALRSGTTRHVFDGVVRAAKRGASRDGGKAL